MKIYLIRHSESVDDILNCYGGIADFELTEDGKNKVKEYSKKFKNYRVEKIYTSPYKRALNSAKILNESINVELEVVDGIREFNQYGVMSGVNKDLAKDIFSHLLNMEQYKDFGYYNKKTFYGGEEIIDFDTRVKDAINEIINNSKEYNTIAIITHGGVYRSIFKNILNIDKKIVGIEDLATTTINYIDGKFIIENVDGVVYGEKI